jgi:ATP/maltotriose-dependent transcriptional regulator MalT
MAVEGRGDTAAGTRHATEALTLYRACEDPLGTGDSLWALGYALAEAGEWSRAAALFEEGINVLREAGDEHVAMWVKRSLAWTYDERGDSEQARELHEQNLTRARALGDKPLQATLLGALAMIAVDAGRLDHAFQMLRENVPIWHELGDDVGRAVNLCRVSYAVALAGKARQAARLLGSAEAQLEELGAAVPWVTRMNDETLATLGTQLDQASVDDHRTWGQALSVDDAVSLALEAMS